jgi:hypothetical protein
MRGWVIAAGVVGGVVLLVWLGKRAEAASIAAPNVVPSPIPGTTPAPVPAAAPSSPLQMYVPVYVNGATTGQTVLWTSSPEQTQLFGPRYPDYFQQEYDRFVFLNQGGFSWVTIDASTGMIVGTGSGTGNPNDF